MNKQKAFLLFIALLINMNLSYCQESKIDSLKSVLKASSSNEIKLSTLENLNKILISNSSLKSSLPYFLEMAEIAKTIGNYELETRAYNYISETYIKEMDSVHAVSFAKKALLINSENNDLNGYLLGINQLGRTYHNFQLYKKAIATYNLGIEKYEKLPNEKYLSIIGQLYSNASAAYEKIGNEEASINAILKGVEIAEKTKSVDEKSYALYALGYKYMGMKNYEKAEKYFLNSLKFSDSVSLLIYVHMNHHGLGINYSRWGKYSQALYHNKIAINFFREQGDKLYEFDALNNTAVVYQRMNKPDSVIIYGKKALKIATEIKHQLAISGANLTLSIAYLDKGEYNKAEEILLQVAKDTINPKVIDISSKASIYSKLSEVYEGKYNYKKSLKFHKIFKTLSDSIDNENLESKFSDIETKYQTEKKEKENLQLKADKAEQAELLAQESKRKWLLGSGLLTALIALAVFSFYYRRNKKQKDVIESLQKELHHRVKNNLSIIDTFIELAKEEFDDFKFSSKLNELQNRIDSINEVHQQLYKNKDVTNLNIKNYIDTLSNNVSNSFSNNKVTIEKQVESNLNLNADKSFPIGLIINEFLTNSYKYAFGNDGGVVKIVMNDLGSNYELLLSDNGKGIPENFDIKTTESFGLRIMKLLTDQLNGEFHLYNKNGINLIINFPK